LVDEDYGDGPNAEEDGDNGRIAIPQTTLKFSKSDNFLLCRTVDSLAPPQNYGKELYKQTLNRILTFTPL